MPEEKKLWFKAKSYGWGWTPSSWQGWLVVLFYAVFVTAGTSFVTKRAGVGLLERSDVFVFMGMMVFATILLIWISYKKGERPRWRWGRDDWNNR